SGGVEKRAQVADGFGRNSVGQRLKWALVGAQRNNDDFSGKRRLLRRGRGFPPADVGSVAADAQHSVRREGPELRDQASVAGGEKAGVAELLRFVAEADEVCGDGWAGLVGVQRERGCRR